MSYFTFQLYFFNAPDKFPSKMIPAHHDSDTGSPSSSHLTPIKQENPAEQVDDSVQNAEKTKVKKEEKDPGDSVKKQGVDVDEGKTAVKENSVDKKDKTERSINVEQQTNVSGLETKTKV